MEVNSTQNKIDILPLQINKDVASLKASKEKFSELVKANLEPVPASPEASSDQPVEYLVKPGDSLWKISKKMNLKDPLQIAQENGLSNPNLIRPGQKLLIYPVQPKETQPVEGGEMVASWYGAEHHNKTTASGQRFDMYKNTLAHKTLPFGTKVRLTNPENGKIAEGVVNDRGPFIKGREVDVSYALARKLGFVRKGITRLNVEIL
jgi:rare lipoprotein A